jgi:remodeling and spacing factor 1
LLKHLDTSLVIETVETETPIRQSRRIAQQKIKEETDRRLMEERLLKQMKEDAEKKKQNYVPTAQESDEKDNSSDESYKGGRKKKVTKIKPQDKQWQTSSSHSEKSESEEEFEQPHWEDPGSPLFRSDHEFSPGILI